MARHITLMLKDLAYYDGDSLSHPQYNLNREGGRKGGWMDRWTDRRMGPTLCFTDSAVGISTGWESLVLGPEVYPVKKQSPSPGLWPIYISIMTS